MRRAAARVATHPPAESSASGGYEPRDTAHEQHPPTTAANRGDKPSDPPWLMLNEERATCSLSEVCNALMVEIAFWPRVGVCSGGRETVNRMPMTAEASHSRAPTTACLRSRLALNSTSEQISDLQCQFSQGRAGEGRHQGVGGAAERAPSLERRDAGRCNPSRGSDRRSLVPGTRADDFDRAVGRTRGCISNHRDEFLRRSEDVPVDQSSSDPTQARASHHGAGRDVRARQGRRELTFTRRIDMREFQSGKKVESS